MLLRLLRIAILPLAGLAACSVPGESNQPSAVSEAPPPLPAPPGPIATQDAPPGLDGGYTGYLSLARNTGTNCPGYIPASASVANGQMALSLGRYSYGNGIGIIGGDAGAGLSGTDFVGDMRIRGDRLSGLVQHTTCPYFADLNKLPAAR
jgi:hypothetical protein